ncbi:MAG: hypothetical protein IPL61_35950 [Myxococcales bacterium]|nr:hypothetical protein [Myxococcales bacterium]
MRLLRVRPEAEDELLAAAQWYEARKLGLGAELVAAIDEVFERIGESPFRRADLATRHSPPFPSGASVPLRCLLHRR